MWPFSTIRELREYVRDLSQELNRRADNVEGLRSRAINAEIAMRKMQRAITDDGLDEITKAVTARVADIYASSHGGVKARDRAVYAVIHAAVREAMLGEKYWNTGQLARDAYKDEA